MIHIFVAMVLLGVTHLVSFWAMTELKFSKRKTALIYVVSCILFVSLVMLAYAMFGDSLVYYAAAFTSTIVMAFFVFLYNSADPLCKKIFLFISYANVFSVLVCVSLIICSVFFKDAPATFIYYTRNILRTVLFIPVALIYIHFLRSSVRAVSGNRLKTWYSISVVSALFLIIFALFVVIFNAEYKNIDRYIPLFAVSVLLYMSI